MTLDTNNGWAGNGGVDGTQSPVSKVRIRSTTSGSSSSDDTDLSSKDGEGIRLKKSLGLFNGVAIIIGTIVGSGIFVSPAGVLIEAKSVGLSLVVWFLCGIICLLGAHCFAELGTVIRKSGGIYSYIQEAYGDLAAFLYLWVALIVMYPAANGVIALTFGYYIAQPFFPSCEVPDSAVRLFAALAITVLTFVNAVSVKWASRIQNLFTVIKTLTLILIILTGLVVIGRGDVENFNAPFEGSSTNAAGITLAFYSGLFSYSGWYTLNFLTEELKNPYKNLPRAIWISMPLVTVIYTLTNVAYFAVLNVQQIVTSEAVAVSFAMRMYGYLGWAMPLCVAFSTFGSLNGCIMSLARLCFVGARQGHFPDIFALICQTKVTPLPAVILQGVTGLLMLITSDVYLLINCVTFIETSVFLFCTTAIFIFRKTRPDVYRPIKISLLWPSLFLVVCVFLVVLPLVQDPRGSFIGLLFTLAGVPVYILGVLWKKPKSIRNKTVAVTTFVQKLTLGLPQEGKIE